jgi:CheY-like chemotaxis protein
MSDKKILIVDDEAAIRSLLRCAVSGPGIVVFEADSGAKALAVAAEQGPFEAVVSDVLMPGMDGVELARKMVAAGQAQRFLFISGYCDMDAIPNRAREFPASAFLSKPFSIPDLLQTFRALLEEQPANGRTASVRDQAHRTALRRAVPPSGIDVLRALCRKTARLRSQRDHLVEDTRWGLHARRLLVGQIASNFAQIQGIERTLPSRRAML